MTAPTPLPFRATPEVEGSGTAYDAEVAAVATKSAPQNQATAAAPP